MKRPCRKKMISALTWTTEQDIYLIENSTVNMAVLLEYLPYTEEQIIERKEALGLLRREWQMRRFRTK
ncbi:acyl-CoA thioesterase [Acinetobacter chengduensis]|uniref:Acyl-CoA thioesterase n=1 Tax=Acinetobacter chengduensis TaxID=2420890 RepID=A0ABX9TYB8_9GAMM|nr:MULTISPECIES: acyl-CoA thioesterase [Acinetobacter]MBI1452422.1 acyl-CoA thioesterase [Acinetobacter sp. FL51]RKG44674.1 acyl-CoA thioesterase [Acinetobacter sp. WCHAc060007]RLL23437.1 acyl-CoA thioesterase [Acinetobacter chengduensis]